MLRLVDLSRPPLEPPIARRRLAWMPVSPRTDLIHATASIARVVIVPRIWEVSQY